jgi:hypothetical protein
MSVTFPAEMVADANPRSARVLFSGVHRYQLICTVVTLMAAIPYLWVLWDLWNGSINPLRGILGTNYPIYDVQARAIMHGHLWIPNGSIRSEAFVTNGHEYTYFGILPSLLRIPVFLFTSSLDGRLFALSILVAWIATSVFCSLLLWRLRIFLRGDATLGWIEAVSYGVLLASVLAGSVLMFLASSPDAFTEDEAWSVALVCGSLFALVGVLERTSWSRITTCGVLVLCTNLNRSTTGYAVIAATLLVSAWFALGRAGPTERRWAIPLAGAALIPLAIGCAINFAKFGQLFGVPFQDQILYKYYGLQNLNGGNYFSLYWLPRTIREYVDPANFRFTSLFPYIFLPDASTQVFRADPTANVPLSMPLLFVSGMWGMITTFAPGRRAQFRALRLLLLASGVTAAVILIFGWIFERFAADFMPLLVLAAMIGMVDAWNRMVAHSRKSRTIVLVVAAALAWFGFWANMAFAITPWTTWNSVQTSNFINVQRTISDLTGHPLDNRVVTGSKFPQTAAQGTLFIQGDCKALYLAYASVTPSYVPQLSWLLVERAPQAPLCHSLVGKR